MTIIDDESVPPWLLYGEIPGTAGLFDQFADLAVLKGDSEVGDGTNWSHPFGSRSYVVLGDASAATWDGTAWSAYSGQLVARSAHASSDWARQLVKQQPPAPLPPLDEFDEPEPDDEPDDEAIDADS